MVQAKKLKVVKNAEIFDDRYFHTELEEFRWDEYLKDTNRKDFNEKRTRRECNNILLLFILKTFWTLVIEDIIYNNVRYAFTKNRRKHVFLSIVNRDTESRRYRYKVKDKGNDFLFYVETSRHIKSKTKKIFFLRYAEKLKSMLRAEVKKGHEYEYLKPYR